MSVAARAPGKVAVLGEYAVLNGAPALVLAVDRRCRAVVGPADGAENRLETRFPRPHRIETPVGADTGIAVVDLIRRAIGAETEACDVLLDSAAFFAGGRKIGLGSSAAALCAFAAAWARWRGVERPPLARLIELHRRFQGGAGSGLDVAASVTGGAIVFRLSDDGMHRVSSVQLPNSVGFAGIFAGRSASTPDLLARYYKWRAERPKEAAAQLEGMKGIAEAGCAAAEQGESEGFLRAVDLYGRELDALGGAIGADIVTREHRALARTAKRFGVIYKVSGAGGGDLGLALAADADALEGFRRAVAEQGYTGVNLGLDRQGLVVEEQTE